jgi:H+/Cl- antiporter ClcA
MDVAWTFVPGPDGVAVTIDHQFIPPWPIVGGLVANHVIGPHFVEAIAGKTLNTIKGIVEDRDRRFRADGTPR